MKTNEIREYLRKIQEDLEKNGFEYFMVVGVPGTKEGASIYNGRNLRDGAATHARAAHTVWEQNHGIDPKHDWSNKAAKPKYVDWHNKR